jgi:ABC-type Mn2+/Zn2+ transport system permease subunit
VIEPLLASWQDFVASWELLRATYLSGVLLAGTLALVGIWVVARDQIFLGAAVSQASTLGVALALWLGAAAGGTAHDASHALHALESEMGRSALAVLAAVATALLVSGREHGHRTSGEAVTGWVFLVSSSVPILMVAHQPHGLETIQRLVFSTLLSARDVDLAVFAVLGAATAVFAWRFWDRLALLAIDPETAGAFGLRRRWWSAAIAIWLGLAVGLAIRTSGAVFTFGCLVLPGLLAKSVCRETRLVIAVAPAVAVAASGAGFFLAHGLDWPPAHTVVALLCAGVAVGWLVPRLGAR